LDLKEEKASSLKPYLKLPQPQWATEAERVVAIQQRAQGTNPALLTPVQINGKPYVLHELQPMEDKIDLTSCSGKIAQLAGVVETMVEVAAWAELRSSGRQGSAIADELIEFASRPAWQADLLRLATSYAQQVEADFQEFCAGAKALSATR
jgi:uncharacterized protein (DUF2252 family)